MKNELILIEIKGLMPTANGTAVFLGNKEKTFVIHMDPAMGLAISLHVQNVQKDRPLTHDLIRTIFLGLGVSLEHVIINDIQESTFFARVILFMKNELGTKLVELDARPSDAIILALQAEKPIFVTKTVLDKVEDISDLLKKLQEEKQAENEKTDSDDFPLI